MTYLHHVEYAPARLSGVVFDNLLSSNPPLKTCSLSCLLMSFDELIEKDICCVVHIHPLPMSPFFQTNNNIILNKFLSNAQNPASQITEVFLSIKKLLTICYIHHFSVMILWRKAFLVIFLRLLITFPCDNFLGPFTMYCT